MFLLLQLVARLWYHCQDIAVDSHQLTHISLHFPKLMHLSGNVCTHVNSRSKCKCVHLCEFMHWSVSVCTYVNSHTRVQVCAPV